MNDQQKQFISKARVMAKSAQHPWPDYAACEAALESNFGMSGLALQANNLFGRKAHQSEIVSKNAIAIPTWEYFDLVTVTAMKSKGEILDTDQNDPLHVKVNAWWAKFPDYEACFVDRYLTLQRLASKFAHYMAALKATNGNQFVTEVSQTWSTDPNRASKVLSIYKQFFG